MGASAAKQLNLRVGSREAKLDKLLEHYNDAKDPMYARSGIRGGDSGTDCMPPVWNASYRELERCLKRMRALSEEAGAASPVFRSWFYHLSCWYLQAQRRRAPLMRTDKRGREYHVTTGAGPQYVIEVRREGNPAMVVMGLGWISAEFCGSIDLPKEFIEAA